ncbi:M20 family metallopeptidase [Halovivax gelatinilyticus]|uniref:M20 family metallopeptidase n=1 Tax=Halovivax gelatinilyticus TaxID=2961597 RepID=UPI0020CA44DD|nr:M20/M25/M40 family metallo-hydrolase [Halovivax gelatinilyticus]
MELASLTRELVSIPSHVDETAAGDAIEDWLDAETDASVERDPAGNVLARRGSPGGPSLAMVGHHDVVPPDDSQVVGDTYDVFERDGRLHGRGTADMKGALAAMLLAFRDADLSPGGSRERPAELVFASFVGEEVGGEGARHAIDRGFAPDVAVVGEGSTNYSQPGVTDVVVAHKGRRASTITATGVASHASEPESGENAIYRASEAVDVVQKMPVSRVAVAEEELCGSVVVTEIEGGSAWNVVPERCSFTVDERTVPGERAPLERLESIDGVEWTVEQDLPPMACSDDGFAETALEAVRAVHERRGAPHPAHTTKPHATDAGWLADRAGTACVIVGPAEPGEAHTAEESVSVAVLERCRECYDEIAARWVQSVGEGSSTDE